MFNLVDAPYHFIALGAGVDSSAMALMAAHGEITPMPDAAIFADTMAETPATYEWLDYLEILLPFPVIRVSAGNLEHSILTPRVSKKGRFYLKTNAPFFTLNKGKKGKINQRTCTRDFKINVCNREMRQLAQVKRGQKEIIVTKWLGFSREQLYRMKPPREPWIQHRYPLIELDLYRQQLIDWMLDHGYPEPPRSACYFCPFRSNQEWKKMQETEADYFKKAIDFDEKIRTVRENSGFDSLLYVHRDLRPLGKVDLSSREEVDLFNNICEGECGT